MDEDILIIMVSAITGLAAMGSLLTGWWLWLRSRSERLRAGSAEDVKVLHDAVARLRTEMEAVYGELSTGQQELHERIDFAERLLTQSKEERTPK
jgi:hypothetical protein